MFIKEGMKSVEHEVAFIFRIIQSQELLKNFEKSP